MKPKKKSPQKKQLEPVFPDSISGTMGTFVTPSGTISYLLTKATLRFKGTARGDEAETSRLTSCLAPVREIIDVSQLGFDQLLQRDLDDNRIAHELIPYILGGKSSGKPLFPPIVAMLLPFGEDGMAETYESLTKKIRANDEWEGEWDTQTFGDSFRIEVPPEGILAPNSGILRWNRDKTRLVVLDGQHRAMSLLAIHRIKNGNWPASASKFELFYKEPVEQRLKAAQPQFPELIELPVMLVWVPDQSSNLPETVRKLFVDINNNARIPSPSRILLLSDEHLDNHLTRRFLSLVREEESGIPLASVEYDYPSDGKRSVGKWSCFSNIEILRELIRWSIIRARQVLDRCNIEVIAKGKKSGGDYNISLQQELRVATLGKDFEDGNSTILTKDISNTVFPRFNKEKLEKLLNNFDEYHGRPIIELFANSAPYSAHFAALEEFEATFRETYGVNSTTNLCYEALFEGQGVYWTIKRGADPKKSKNLALCWSSLSKEMMNRFCKLRAIKYLGGKPKEELEKDTNALFEQLRTIAAQGGLVLLYGTIAKAAGANSPAKRVALAKLIASGVTAGLTKGGGKASQFILSSGRKGSLNRLPRLEPRLAAHWRYLWFEVMTQGLGTKGLEKSGLSEDNLNELLAQGRAYYAQEIVKYRMKALKRSEPMKKIETFRGKAEKSVLEELALALGEFRAIGKAAAKTIWKEALISPLGESQNTVSNESGEIDSSDNDDIDETDEPEDDDLI